MNNEPRILILDNGAPISPEIIEALASRGVRVDTSATQQHKLFEQHREEEEMRASQIMVALLGAGLQRSGFARTVPARDLVPVEVQSSKKDKAIKKRERKAAQRLRLEEAKASRARPLGVPAPRDTVAPLTITADAGEVK